MNRSTFYLHYETVNDLLNESIEFMKREFSKEMTQNADAIVPKPCTCPEEELYLVTPAYLKPYLDYIQAHKRLFRTAMEHAETLKLLDTYDRMYEQIFAPILDHFKVPECDRAYLMKFYIQGIIAIISEWLNADFSDLADHVIQVIQQ